MNIDFIDKLHAYVVDGEVADITVTELLRKHGISPDYSFVKTEILTAAADEGTARHAELENIAKGGEPTSIYGVALQEWFAGKDAFDLLPERRCALKGAFTLAGTADIIGHTDDFTFLGDYKFTSTFHKSAVTWQVNLYDYMIRKSEGLPGANKFFGFHFKDGKMKVYELPKIPDEEIEKLLKAEENGELYNPVKLTTTSELQKQWENAEQTLIAVETQYKAAQEQAKALREEMCKLMKEQGVKSFETDNLKLTFVDESERTTVDSKKLQAEFPEIYDQVKKTSKINATVRVTVKKNGTNKD